MQENLMVNDVLCGLNGEISKYSQMIPHIEHDDLKAALIKQRNAAEQSQDELYKLSREKGYHIPSSMATQDEINHVKSLAEKNII